MASSRSLRSSRRGSSDAHHRQQHLQTARFAARLEQLLLERCAEVDGGGDAERQGPLAGGLRGASTSMAARMAPKASSTPARVFSRCLRLGVVVELHHALQVLRHGVVRLAHSRRWNRRPPSTRMFMRPSSSCSITSATRAVQPYSRSASSVGQDDAELTAVEPLLHEPLVALLEDVQRQDLAGQQHQVEREQRRATFAQSWSFHARTTASSRVSLAASGSSSNSGSVHDHACRSTKFRSSGSASGWASMSAQAMSWAVAR